jgi:Nucleotide-binding protein implicated in inhibition of septum formation
LSMEEINYYIDTCQPYDKAGGYGIQEWLGHCKISKMEGSYTNIMGLPVREVYQHLQTFLA